MSVLGLKSSFMYLFYLFVLRYFKFNHFIFRCTYARILTWMRDLDLETSAVYCDSVNWQLWPLLNICNLNSYKWSLKLTTTAHIRQRPQSTIYFKRIIFLPSLFMNIFPPFLGLYVVGVVLILFYLMTKLDVLQYRFILY